MRLFRWTLGSIGPFAALATAGIAIALLGTVGCDEPDPCANIGYPSATGPVLHVSGACGSSGGDGSAQSPYGAIGTALERAAAGTTVVVSAGIYRESLTLPPGVNLVGSAVHLRPIDGVGLTIAGKGSRTVRSIKILEARGIGIDIDQAEVLLDQVEVQGTNSLSAAQPGHGIRANGAAKLTLQRCQVTDSAGIGVAVTGSGPVVIIDPLFMPAQGARSQGQVAIIDPLFMPASRITSNAMGGVAIIDPLFMPGSTAADLQLVASDIGKNGKYGVALFGASARIERSALHDSTAVAGAQGDGLILAAATQGGNPGKALSLSLDAASLITRCARLGMLIAAPAKAEVAGEVSRCEHGGVWAQGIGAAVEIQGPAVLAQNAVVGVAASAGARLTVLGARIADTRALAYTAPGSTGSADLADGVGVFSQASGKVSGAKLIGNLRAGVIGHSCATKSDGMPDLLIENTVIQGSKYGVVVAGQFGAGAAAASAPEDGDNSYADVDSKQSTDVLAVQENPCGNAGETCALAP
jgi:hypothetical protein